MSRARVADGSAVDLTRWQSATSRSRLAVMALVGVLVAVLAGLVGAWWYAPLLGWDAAALVFAGWVWSMIATLDSAGTAAHATAEDPGRVQSDLFVVLASVASLLGVGVVLTQAASQQGSARDLLAALGLVSIALSWWTVHTLFTLRYARLYYGGVPGGIDFNQQAPQPRYLDFAYLAFTVGMTFQVSDTELKTPAVRATVLRHALLAYLFGAVILAATINLISSLASK